jgi:hypothetical protein
MFLRGPATELLTFQTFITATERSSFAFDAENVGENDR